MFVHADRTMILRFPYRTSPLKGCRRWGEGGHASGSRCNHTSRARAKLDLGSLINGLGSLVPPFLRAPGGSRRFLAAQRPVGAGTGARRKGGRETRPCTGLA